MSAVRRLQLVGIEDEPAKGPPAPGVVRVAIATRDMKGLNAHFGSAPRFAVYDVTKDGWDFVEAVAFDDNSDESGAHKGEGEDRITPKVAATETGIVTAGMTVAQNRRRNSAMTMTTKATAIAIVNLTSEIAARISCVRS